MVAKKHMKLVNLFIDESGSENPKTVKAGLYIICGCMASNQSREKLKVTADQIKFKFWDRTNIVFHSREIWRKEGDFSILKDSQINKQFCKHLFNFLSGGGYQIMAVVVDHRQAAKKNWNSKKVYKETASIIVRGFILALLAAGNRGRLVIESATSEKDFNFHKAAGHYLANGIKELDVSCNQVQNVLTEISFVSKKNFDIEEQVADLLAYGAKLKFLKKNKSALNEYDKQILRIANQKLFQIHPNMSGRKKKFYSKIESFKILP